MSILRCALTFASLAILTSAVPLPEITKTADNSDTSQAAETVDYRLPTNVKPTDYTIKLIPNIVPNNFTFTGESDIVITVSGNATNEIVLHAKDLNITKTQLLKDVSPVPEGLNITTVTEEVTDFFRIKLAPAISAGTYKLHLEYSGVLNNELKGFYRSSYVNKQGQKVWLATTQFEPTHARRAFPCFDEPALKATFTISIKHFRNQSAISNMAISAIRRPEDDLTKWWTDFDKTPIMSTYLVAFIVSDFGYLSTDDGKFSVYSRNDQRDNRNYTLEIGPKELKALEDYTGIAHVIPKMDNVAIPDFEAGAMENWGIVTYRESALLFEENVTTTEGKQRIATVISHEFVHQWFGNLVSPLWWNYVWLNEGFATYFEYFITDKVDSSWRLMEQFVIKNLQEGAFVADDNATQHAMDATVANPVEIKAIFDKITYNKAGSVIRMISHVIGEAAFQDSLKNYLKKNSMSAASSDHLITALKEAVNATVSEKFENFLTTYIKQAGYPVITVIRNHTTGSCAITQKRFLTNKISETKSYWMIPINYVTEDKIDFDDTKPLAWLPNNETPVYLSGIKSGWMIFNKQQTGYYRVNYDAENWRLIAEYLKNPNNTKKIHILNRAQLLDDSFNLAQAGELENHAAFLDISQHLQDEDDYVPWYAAYRAFSVLNRALVNTEKYNLFKLYVQRLTGKLEKTLGYDENSKDDPTTKFNRMNTIKLACTMGSSECLAATHEKLLKHLDGSNEISPDLRSVAVCAGMRSANATTWDTIYNLTIEMSKDSNDRSTYVNALGCLSNEEILKRYMQNSISVESRLTPQKVIKAVYDGTPAGIDVAFDFVTTNMKFLVNELDANHKNVLDYLKAIAARMTTSSQVAKLEKFIEGLDPDSKDLADALKNDALAEAKKNIEWLKKYEPHISSFLNAQKLVDDETKAEPDSSNISFPSLTLIFFTLLGTVYTTANY